MHAGSAGWIRKRNVEFPADFLDVTDNVSLILYDTQRECYVGIFYDPSTDSLQVLTTEGRSGTSFTFGILGVPVKEGGQWSVDGAVEAANRLVRHKVENLSYKFTSVSPVSFDAADVDLGLAKAKRAYQKRQGPAVVPTSAVQKVTF